MALFENMFMESKGKPVLYMGEEIFLLDKIMTPNEFIVEISLLSHCSNWRQGIVIQIDGKLELNSVKSSKFVLWEENFDEKPIKIKCYANDGYLTIWNVWDTGNGVIQAWHNGAAMKKEIKNAKIIYSCNDGHDDDDFSNITFSLEVK